MSAESLRRQGPIKGDYEGEDRNFPTKAEPHPDSLNPKNDLGKHMCADVPKTGLGARGHAMTDK